MDILLRILLVGLGGFLGANARYLLGGWLTRFNPGSFPAETFVINITGSFVLGLFMTLATGRFAWPVEYRLLVAIGFVGSYTTFSTWTYETLALLEQGDVLRAGVNVVLSSAVGLAAVYAGVVVGRLV